MDKPEFQRLLFGDGDDLATITTGRARIERRRLGAVDLPDGRIYACDPLVPMDVQPFAQRVEPGVYEAVLFVAVRTSPDSAGLDAERNAAAALVFASELPVTWSYASREGGAPESGDYGVDSGTGCLVGSRAAETLFGDNVASADSIHAALKQTDGAVVVLQGGCVAAAFRTGLGDGVYGTWWGYNARGEVAMIVTDFDILRPTAAVAAVHAERARRGVKKWWQVWK